MTLFGQDWGGLIGLRLLCDNQEHFNAVMIGNTALPTGDHDLGEPFKEWRKFTQTNESFKIGPIIHRGSVSGLTKSEIDAYNAPFPDDSYKEAARQFPLLVPHSTDDPSYQHNVEAWEVLKKWEKPLLCAFSDQDPVTRGGEKAFMSRVPGTANQPHVTVENAGHFVQEDQPDQVVRILIDLIARETAK